MRTRRTVLVAAGAALLLPFTSPAFGATTTAAGSASSSATLLTLVADGHTIVLGSFTTAAQSLDATAPNVRFVPATVNDVKFGEVVVDPTNSPQSIGGVSAPGVPAGVLTATSPSAELRAAKPATGPISELDAGLGSASLLGIPLSLDGELAAGSETTGTQAMAGKSVTISGISLPSIADLLAALGIDLTKLPVETLNGLFDQLPLSIPDLVVTAADVANDAIDQAQADVDTAQQTADNQQVIVDGLQAALVAAQDAFNALIDGSPYTQETWAALPEVGKQLEIALYAAWTALQTAQSDYDAAVVVLNGLLTTLDTLIDALQDAIGDLADIVAGVLDDTPIAEIDSAEVTTLALASGSRQAVVSGSVTGLKVLGQDVLAAVFGTSTLDIADLLDTGAGTVNSAIATATGTLSSVLSAVTGAVGLVVPAPVIKVMEKTTVTGTDGAFGTANATVTVLSVSFAAIELPDDFALQDADLLPGVTSLGRSYVTEPFSMQVASLSDAARFRPGTSTSGPGTGNELPATGAPIGLAVLATLALAGGVGIKRFART